MQAIKAKADADEGGNGKKFKKFLHLYLCFACQLCYHKPVQEALSEEYHELMPNQDSLKACFQFVVSKDKRQDAQMDSPDEEKADAEANGDSGKVTVHQEVDSIMEVLGKKGEDTVALLRALLADESKIQSKDLKLKQVLIEILFLKYGSQSLEHVSRGIEKIKPVLEEQFKDQRES